MVVDAGWLEQHGVSRQLRRKYVMHGWLLPLARGVYRRPAPSEQPARYRGKNSLSPSTLLRTFL